MSALNKMLMLASLFFLAILTASACSSSSGDQDNSSEIDSECIWGEDGWDECDWA
ncbi:ABC-type Fe3+-citrate transport system substrate-binding protein [Natronospira proteinivora]|uniref:ABC-type Fe3+-citrate transport system substrate-binding protein n=1 Tax=Natronospira proteinivora TaxID=1807133 RepID=A0ABT1GBK0_9GAMM|nr:hypothetical protein [Natronospira proteinivora]MCP1727658.1 ABC-type Fe3+-citrate transport system substrate-binding protein [Natronospira proteinivora]